VDLDSNLPPIDTSSKTRTKRLKFDDKIEMLIYERPAVEKSMMDYEIEYKERRKQIRNSLL
jgi:hypothetical protein